MIFSAATWIVGGSQIDHCGPQTTDSQLFHPKCIFFEKLAVKGVELPLKRKHKENVGELLRY